MAEQQKTILRFLKGVPYALGELMVREYDDKCRELARWRTHSRSSEFRPYLSKENAIHFFFALGIYYRYVIAPLTSSANFFDRLEINFNAGLKVGGRTIDAEFRNSILGAVGHFETILRDFGLTPRFFAQTDVKTIVSKLIEVEKSAKND